jgi:hypothetical protein
MFVEDLEAAAGDGFPFRHRGGVQDAVDVVETQPGVLQHADEDESTQRLGPVSAPPRLPCVGVQEAAALVVADRGGGHVGLLGHLADGEEFGHGTARLT